MLRRPPTTLALLAALFTTTHGYFFATPPPVPRGRIRVAPSPRLELGLQVDPAASAGSVFVLGGFGLLQLKIRSAIQKREARDAAAETFRKAEVLLLAAKLSPEEVESAQRALREAADEYEEARRLFAVGGALLRIPDPTAGEAERLLRPPSPPAAQQPQQPPQPPQPLSQSPPSSDALDGVRSALGLKDPNAPPPPPGDSLLPSGSASLTLKDAAIAFVFVLQLGWFLLSLTDPIGKPNALLEAALTSGGDYVDSMEARKAAESEEYRAMLQRAVDSGEAPPLCATAALNDPLGGCTRVDASRGWISGPGTGSG